MCKARHHMRGFTCLKPPNMNEDGSSSEQVRTCEALSMCPFFIKISFEKIEHMRVLIGYKVLQGFLLCI
jgi:hypothetical protein